MLCWGLIMNFVSSSMSNAFSFFGFFCCLCTFLVAPASLTFSTSSSFLLVAGDCLS